MFDNIEIFFDFVTVEIPSNKKHYFKWEKLNRKLLDNNVCGKNVYITDEFYNELETIITL